MILIVILAEAKKHVVFFFEIIFICLIYSPVPKVKHLSYILDKEKKLARRSGEHRDSDFVNKKFHEVLHNKSDEREKEKEREKRVADISNKRRQAVACRSDRRKAVPEDECGDCVPEDECGDCVPQEHIEEEVVAEAFETDANERRELGRAQFYNKRKELFMKIPKSQNQRLKLITLLTDVPVFQVIPIDKVDLVLFPNNQYWKFFGFIKFTIHSFTFSIKLKF